MSKESLFPAYRHHKLPDESEWLSGMIAGVLATTICNRRCPLCCYRDVIHGDDTRHFLARDILDEIAKLHRVGSVYISGGEPTLHPEIEHILLEGRKIRGAAHFGIITNGAQLLKIAPATKYVDTVRLSLWGEDSAVAVEYSKVKPQEVELLLTTVVHYDYGGGAIPCIVLTNSLSVMNGRVYPCCVAAGIAGAQSTELNDGWEKRLLSIEAPCERCVNGRY